MKKQDKKIHFIAMTGILAAMITLMTAYICHIPVGTSGGYIHLGDALIYLGAVLLPKPYAIAAAVIGGGLADLLTAPMWMPATIVIKLLIVLSFTSKTQKLLNVQNVAALFVGAVITVVGYFIAEYLLFGTWAAFLASALPNMIQGTGSAIVFVIIALALEKTNFKQRIMNL